MSVACHLHGFCQFFFFYKKETVSSPQKKVPEPISYLALSPGCRLTMTWLTLKAHLCIAPVFRADTTSQPTSSA